MRFPMRFAFLLATLGLATMLRGTPLQADDASEKVRIYIGTYTGDQSKGIYVSTLNLKTGALAPAEVAAEVSNPSFVAIHPHRQFLYAVNEVSDTGGKPTGAVTAFAIDPSTGKLKRLNQQPSQGVGPCHLVVDADGKNVLVANYGGGSVASLPIASDGTLAAAVSAIQHAGSSVNKQRQEGPHAHSINLDPANRFAYVADLGLDKVLIYRFDGSKGVLTANDPPFATVAPGAGPRHFAVLPGGQFAYVINELANTVTVFRVDPDHGTLTTLQDVSTLPNDFSGTSYTAEVVVHPTGKFVYGSNRGHDSIAMFAVDGKTGKLTPRGHQLTQGKTPRNFAIDPTGTFLLAENQGSNTIVVFKIDPATGSLSSTGHTLDVPVPVCVRFVPAAR